MKKARKLQYKEGSKKEMIEARNKMKECNKVLK